MKLVWNPLQFILTWILIILLIGLVMYFKSSYSIILSTGYAGVVWLPYFLTAIYKFLVHYNNKSEIYLYCNRGWIIFIIIMGCALINGIYVENNEP
jgi:hypothetical protein